MKIWLFLIQFIEGFASNPGCAFATSYSEQWGQKKGSAIKEHSLMLFQPGVILKAAGMILVYAVCIFITAALFQPGVKDAVQEGSRVSAAEIIPLLAWRQIVLC